MDDFSIIGSSFNEHLKNLRLVLKRCMGTNLVLNWEKCHFMVQEGIVLGHRIFEKGIKVLKSLENYQPLRQRRVWAVVLAMLAFIGDLS